MATVRRQRSRVVTYTIAVTKKHASLDRHPRDTVDTVDTVMTPDAVLRVGLCCQFAAQPIRFRTTTATALLRLPASSRLTRVAEVCRANADALRAALEYCAAHGIRAFRINSQILPVKTHPTAGYKVGELPGGAHIIARFQKCGQFARANDLRLSFHPDQFVVLNSPNPKTLAHSLAELSYQAEVAEWVGADSGTYWRVNPKEYADPRKHGAEYRARGKRPIRRDGRSPRAPRSTAASRGTAGRSPGASAGARPRLSSW